MDVVVVQGLVFAQVTPAAFIIASQEPDHSAPKMNFLDLLIFDAVVGGRHHLVLLGQVEPELDAQHPIGGRQRLFMQDP